MDGEAAEPAEGSLPRDGVSSTPLFTHVYYTLLLWRAFGSYHPGLVGGLLPLAPRVPANDFVNSVLSVL